MSKNTTTTTTAKASTTKAKASTVEPVAASNTIDQRAFIVVEERPVPKATTITVGYVERDTLAAYKDEIGAKSINEAIDALLVLAGYDMAGVES
jgi:hypothetical protein